MGFEPKIVGNCKGFLDYYQTPAGVLPFVPPGQNPVQLCANADGSKQSFEMTILGNAFGYFPLKRGMCGPRTDKSSLIKTFNGIISLEKIKGTVVDYVMGIDGIDQGGGVFVVAGRNDRYTKDDMHYLKKGEGPFYLFFRDHHLCYFESLSSIAEAVLFNTASLSPKGRYTDVVALAKRPLPAGHKLDGIGGYDCYGLVEKASVVSKENLLPLGLAEFATLRKNIVKDTVITYDMVDIKENKFTELRKEQERLPLEKDLF
jgi:predicted homoserine dehydrogenase-like protein